MPEPVVWVATVVHLDGRQFEVAVVHPEMPLLEDFAAAMLSSMDRHSIRPRRGGRRNRSRLRTLKDCGLSIDGIRPEPWPNAPATSAELTSPSLVGLEDKAG